MNQIMKIELRRIWILQSKLYSLSDSRKLNTTRIESVTIESRFSLCTPIAPLPISFLTCYFAGLDVIL